MFRLASFCEDRIWGKFAYLTTRGQRGSRISAIKEPQKSFEPSANGDRTIEIGWSLAPSSVPGVCHVHLNLRTTPVLSGQQAPAELKTRLLKLATERTESKVRSRSLSCQRAPALPHGSTQCWCVQQLNSWSGGWDIKRGLSAAVRATHPMLPTLFAGTAFLR